MIVPLHVDFTDTTLIDEIKLKDCVLCDGHHGTPDLRGRFIWGGSSRRLGNAFSPRDDDTDSRSNSPYMVWSLRGGRANTTLVKENIPSHQHSLNLGQWHYGNNQDAIDVPRGGINFNENHKHGDQHTKYEGGDTDGSTRPHVNTPPYMVLAYFMYLPNWQDSDFNSRMLTNS
jgi:microcystin-dependent protein